MPGRYHIDQPTDYWCDDVEMIDDDEIVIGRRTLTLIAVLWLLIGLAIGWTIWS